MVSGYKDLRSLLDLDRLTHVVDLGASPMDGPPSYQPLLDAKMCRVTGFEPDSAACDELNDCKGSNETYLPYAISDGQEHTLYVCANPGWTSLFKPSATALECFPYFKSKARVLRREPIQTRRLDDFDLDSVDFLKMDIQASELATLRGGITTLLNVVMVQLEMQFVDLYDGQPTFGEIDLELRSQNFTLHTFFTLKKWPISPLRFGDDETRPFNQLLEADAVYIRDITRPECISSNQLKHLALISHSCYGSADLAGRCIMLLEGRGVLPAGSVESYIKIITSVSDPSVNPL